MLAVILLITFAIFSNAEKRASQPIDTYSLDSFLKVLRTSILDKVATEWNVTISQAEVLQKQMVTCNQQIQSEVTKCKACTGKVCQQQPPLSAFLHQSNPIDALKQPLNNVGASLDNVVQLLGTKSFTFLDAMKGIASEGVNGVGDGLKTAFVGLGHGLNDLGKLTIDGLGDLGKFTIHGLSDLGESIGDGFKTAGEQIAHGITSIFGRRRRYLDSVDIECMKRCDNDCWKLMTNDNAVMVSNVCGAMVVALNTTVHNSIEKINTMYNATLDTSTPIVSKVEIDTSVINSYMEISMVYITANIKGKQVRYQSSVPYKLMDLPSTAKQMAQELWNRWY